MIVIALLLAASQTKAPPERMLDCGQVDRAIEASRDEPLPVPRTLPDLQVSAHQPLCGGWEIIDVWTDWQTASRMVHARRKRMNPLGILTVDLLDTERCPAFRTALKGLERISVSAAAPAPAGRPGGAPPPIAVADGTFYDPRAWSARQVDGSHALIRIAQSEGPIGQWMEGLQTVAACWQPQR